MSVDSVGAYATQTATAAADTAASMASSEASGIATPQLSESDFLSLLVAQMQDQDPTQPSDPTAFVSQLASFSEVSGMDSMQSSMSNLASSMLASQVASGTSLIGQQVIASTTTASLTTGGTVTGALNVPSTATSVQVQVTDSNGNAVSTFSVTPPSGGGDDHLHLERTRQLGRRRAHRRLYVQRRGRRRRHVDDTHADVRKHGDRAYR